jgi:hypothetical protein
MASPNQPTANGALIQFWEIVGPEFRMDLIFSLDPLKETIDVRSVVVYAVKSDRIIVSQTHPPVDESFLQKEIEATFLLRDESAGTVRRWGYATTLQEMIPRYPHPGGNLSRPALRIGVPEGTLREAELRLHHRISILPEYGITIQIPPGKIAHSLLKLSYGGALVSFEGQIDWAIGQIVPFQISFPHQNSVVGEAEVRNLTWKEDRGRTLVGLRFVNLEPHEARFLERMVSRLMRWEREGRQSQKTREA